jgi:hypothetical protein
VVGLIKILKKGNPYSIGKVARQGQKWPCLFCYRAPNGELNENFSGLSKIAEYTESRHCSTSRVVDY